MATTNQNRKAPTAAKTVPGSKVRAEVVRVTPQIAGDWLNRNTRNRPLRPGRVEQLAAVITRGEWELNGDAIRWNEDGTALLDGQHRLWAVVEADEPIDTLVVYGIATVAQETMDMGARRNLKDVLALRGIRDAAKLAATLSLMWRWQEGYIRMPSAKPSPAQAVTLYEACPGLLEVVRESQRWAKHFRMSSAVSAAAQYRFSTIDQDAADVFFEKLGSGVGLDEGSPILALRQWLIRQSGNTVAGSRANSVMTLAIMVKAWNAYREGRHVEVITWRPTGIKAEPFPVPA